MDGASAGGGKFLADKAAFFGPGLMAGSLGMALRERGLVGRVACVVRRPEAGALAVELGAADEWTDDPGNALSGAGLVVLGTPVQATIKILESVAPLIEPGAVVTDLGSTKRRVVSAAEEILGTRARFVGGHPMTGSERTGVEAADPYLFENAIYVLTPTLFTDRQALDTVRTMAEGVGGQVMFLAPEDHDLAVAGVSHLPHAVAVSLVLGVRELSKGLPGALSLAAGGFRDTTRVAEGSPEMWRDIYLTNADALIKVIRGLKEVLERIERAVSAGDAQSLGKLLAEAGEIRRGVPRRTKGLLPTTYQALVTVPDRPGVLGRMCALLGDRGINIRDLEILRVREGEGGTIALTFASAGELESAVAALGDEGYRARRR